MTSGRASSLAVRTAVFALSAGAAARAEPRDAPPAEVEVHADRTPSPRGADPTAATTVVAGESLRAPFESATDALGRVPGVEVARTGSSSDLSTAAIRGATSAETPVYLGGVRLNDDVTGTADLSTLPLFLIDRVTVYRGNAPLEADRLGLGGAVFFEPRLPQSTEIGGGAGIGSFGAREGFVEGGVAGGPAAALVAVRRDGADNDYPYPTQDGRSTRRLNADFTATDAWTLARISLGPGARITTLLHAYEREQGSPGLAPVPNDRARTETSRLLGSVSGRLACGHDASGVEDCTVELATSALESRSALDDPLYRSGPSRFTTTEGRRFETQARVSGRFGDLLDLGGGVVGAVEHVAVERSDAAEGVAARRTSVRPAATATLHAGARTDVLALAALECETTESSGRRSETCQTLAPAGRLGVRQALAQGVDVRANVGHYTRIPTLGELYGVSAIVQGNARLAAETGETADLGLSAGFRAGSLRGSVDAFGFLRSAEDLVAYRQNALGIVVPYNVGRARVLGSELAFALDASGTVRAELSATLLDPRDTTAGRTLNNDILPYRSRLVTSDLVEIYSNEGLPALSLGRASLGVRVTHRASRYADSAGLIVIPHQTTFDLETRLSFFRDSLWARAALRNVFDAHEFDSVGLPLPGRSAHFTLEAAWR